MVWSVGLISWDVQRLSRAAGREVAKETLPPPWDGQLPFFAIIIRIEAFSCPLQSIHLGSFFCSILAFIYAELTNSIMLPIRT